MDKQLLKIKEDCVKEKTSKEKKSNTLSHIRLILFFLFLMATFFYFKTHSIISLSISIITILIFICLVYYHNKIIKEIKRTKDYIERIIRYENRLNDKWKEEYLRQEEEYDNTTIDLDILGGNSLLKYINFTNSLGGKRNLIHSLSLNKYDKNTILKNQSSITELKDKQDFILEFQYRMSKIENMEKTDYKEFFSYFTKGKEKRGKILFLSLFLSCITIIIAILSLCHFLSSYFLILLILIQTAISYFYTLQQQQEFESINKTARNFSNLTSLFAYIEKEEFTATYNKKLQASIQKGKESLKALANIATLNSFRLNFITYIIMNAFCSLNFLIIDKYQQFLCHQVSPLKESIIAMEEFEKLISLTTICFVKKTCALPQITDTLSIDAKEIKHPLLKEDNCISNDFNCQKDINIITGSNMSGKTSFMKTIGMNLVLAYNGAYVNATSFTFPVTKIFTSINIKDDINKGISTFYGELKRIKNVLDYSKKNSGPMIIFIDEIFKGTNYNDRILGAKETLNQLASLNCIVFLTTHDFELCEIKNKTIKNYHFSEKYKKDKILFDYKIKEGQCKTTNAKYLMKQMKIIDK